jgi:hypothetical protein
MSITIKAKCEEHPRYKGIKEPTVEECDPCWELYDLRGAAEVSVGFFEGLTVEVK